MNRKIRNRRTEAAEKRRKKQVQNRQQGAQSGFGRTVPIAYRMSRWFMIRLQRNEFMQPYLQRLQHHLQTVYPHKESRALCLDYLSYKLMQTILLLLAAALLTLLVVVSGMPKGTEVTKLERSDYWQEPFETELTAQGEDQSSTVRITVYSRAYASDQIEQKLLEEAKKLPEYVRGENESLDHVTTDLNLIQKIPDSCINVIWDIPENQVLHLDGTLNAVGQTKEGTKVVLTATLQYEDCQAVTSLETYVYESKLTEEERFAQTLTEEMTRREEADRMNKEFTLPQQLEGKTITYRVEANPLLPWMIAAFSIICAVLLFFVQDERLSQKTQKRRNQMLLDYPALVSRLTLYLGTGMTIRSAMDRLAADYERRRARTEVRFAYEELVYVCRKMQGGVSEHEGIELYGRRCELQAYKKLSTLLLLNLKKGSSAMSSILSKEADLAFEERKNSARKTGEEAATKLLFPMLAMLLVVLVILIVPAWMTMQI